jgi:antitoxin component YwqK of YwqJK toxin-antitoxin module/Tfp pilus assembly protein PilF
MFFIFRGLILISSLFFVVNVVAQDALKSINSAEVMARGADMYSKKKYKEAVEIYKSISRNDTNYVDVLRDLSQVYYADSNYQAGKEKAEEGLKFYPEKADEWFNLIANNLDQQARQKEAIAYYDSIILHYQHAYLAWFNKGISYYNSKQMAEAKKCLQQSILINPYYPPAHYQLGNIASEEGNLVAAILSYSTSLIVNPESKYSANCVTMLSNISKMTDDITKKAAGKKASSMDDFDLLQEIIISKIALDGQYKLKASLEDPIVRQLQVVFEKLTFNKEDKGFWMQYYVPFYEQILKQEQFEAFVYYIFSGLDIKDIKAYVKKNQKKIDAFTSTATPYFNEIRETQILELETRKKQETKFLFVNNVLSGKGKIAGEGEKAKAIEAWEFYFENGALKSKGNFNDKQEKNGVWEFYHNGGGLKERSLYVDNKGEGKTETWYTNGRKAGEDMYKAGELDGLSTEYFYNGLPRKTEHYKAGKKEGAVVGFTHDGTREYTAEYKNDLEEGTVTYYHKNGKVSSVSNYKAGKAEGAFKSYFVNGNLKLEGNFADGKRIGQWKDYFNSGQLKSVANYIVGEMNGEYLAYYWNGQPQIKSAYVKDKLEGKYEDFDSDGKLYSDSYYEKGRLKELKFYSKDGKVISNANIRNSGGNLVYYDAFGNKTSEGYFTKEGLRNGKATWYYRDGRISAVINYKEGLMDGERINYYRNGKVSSKINYKDDEENGYKTYYYIDGTKQYEGWMVDDGTDGTHLQYNEFGTVTSKTNYRDNEVEGFLDIYHPNGKIDMEQYYGTGWLKGVEEYDTTGKPIYNLDLQKGDGIYEPKNYNGKRAVQGTYKSHYLNGQHTFLYDDNNLNTILHYKYSILDSSAKQFFYGGKPRYEGQYKMGLRDGKWSYYYANGKLNYTETYDNDRLNGTFKYYNDNGSLDKEISYNEGELNGAFKMFGDNGLLALVINYQQGQLISYTYEGKDGKLVPAVPVNNGTANIIGYYRNGVKSAEINFEDDQVNGSRKLYFSNGKVYIEGSRVYGYDHGLKKVFFEDGTLNQEENYHYNKLHGLVKKYFANGKIESTENWYNGDMHGDNKYYDNTGKLLETRNYYYGALQSVKK